MTDRPKDDAPAPLDRRRFFQRMFLRGVDEVEKKTRELGQRLGQAMAGTAGAAHGAPLSLPRRQPPAGTRPRPGPAPDPVTLQKRRLRPPGALPEPDFSQTCSRGGQCVKACPAQCIRLEPDAADGLPHIVARSSPCVVCDDLACMKACPSGALVLVEAVSQIHMGRAVVNHDTCLRSPGRGGEDCRLCATVCPLGQAAIAIAADDRVDVRAGCIGCGLCERACPTEATSIWVAPRL